MKKDSTSYFGSEEFKELFTKYEDARKQNLISYFDSDQLADISGYYSTLGKYKEAYQTVEYALYLHPGNTEAMIIKAHLLIDENKYDEAELLVEEIEESSNYEVTLLKAELMLIKGELDEAENKLKQYLEIKGKEKDYLIDMAYIFLDNGFPKKAIFWFKEALLDFKGDIEIMEGLAESYFEAEMPTEAIKLYNLLLDEDPYSIEYWAELGKIHFTINEFNKAIEAYEFVTAIDKENRYAILMLGHCYAKLENYSTAETYYKTFSDISDNTDKDHSYYYLGICYYSMGEYKKAIDSFLKGITIDGELLFQPMDIYSYISDCYAELGDKENVLKYIDLAILEDTENAEIYFNKIRFLLKAGEMNEAFNVLNKVIETMPQDVPNTIEAGILFSKFDKYESALSVFSRLENIYPLAYHIFTAFIYNAIKDPISYKEHIQEAIKLSPEGFWEELKDTTTNDGFTQMKNILLEMYDKNK